MAKPRFITEFKGDFRVQYWGPRDENGSGSHNAYYFDNETEAKAKYMELVMRQTFVTMKLQRVVYEVLFDFGGEDKLAFVRLLDSRDSRAGWKC